MKLVLTEKSKINQLVVIFRHLKGIVTDVNIVISKEKFYIQSMDSSHACLVEINIEASGFDNYEVDEDEVLGIIQKYYLKLLLERR